MKYLSTLSNFLKNKKSILNKTYWNYRKNKDFLLFWESFADKKSGATKDVYLNGLKYFRKFVKADLFPFKKLKEDILLLFKKSLLEICKKQNTGSTILACTMSVVAAAERRGLIKETIVVKRIPQVHSPKVPISDKEFDLLLKTECDNLDVKRAFFFSYFSSLRISDLRKVKYSNIERPEGEYALSILTQKTKVHIYNHLNNAVENILYPGKDKEDHVFPGLPKHNSSISYYMRKWVKDAGIERSITMHCARFTYGAMILEQTGNLKLVQEALGHKSILTTARAYGYIKPDILRKATILDGKKFKFGKIMNNKSKKAKGKTVKRKITRRKKRK